MTRSPLPIDAVLSELVDVAKKEYCLVLSAPPGSGKTTRVPGALVDAGIEGEVVVLEPRRLAARAAARRVANERGAELGGEVGYQVRHDRKVSKRTRIRFVTDGILLRRLVSDPFLEGIGAVILDEFHERHIESDLVLAMLKEVRETVRPDLIVLVMSATLDAEPIQSFLGTAPLVTAEGRSFPVTVVHADRAATEPLEEQLPRVLTQALDETSGDVLVFLPGKGEIQRAQKRLEGLCRTRDVLLMPLHGGLDAKDQDRVLEAQARRKIVLATNIAESSLTIEGISAVVDTGEARVLRHDQSRGLDSLRIERISKASADQRAGRAGRTGPGRCYRLWSRAEERGMVPFDAPEVRRIDLAGAVLEVRAFAGKSALEFHWFERPDEAAVLRADALLAQLGAVAAGCLTEIGTTMLSLPMHPRLARMMIEARRRGVELAAATVAALLSERDIGSRRRDGGGGASLADRIEMLARAEQAHFAFDLCRARGVDAGAARAVARARDQILGRRKAASSFDVHQPEIAWCVLAGFPDRVCRRREEGSDQAVMVGGRGVRVVGGQPLEEELFVAVEARESSGRQLSVSLVSLWVGLEREALEEVFPGSETAEVEAVFDHERAQVVGVRRTRFWDLVLSEQRGGQLEPGQVEAVLAAQAARDPFAHLGPQKDLRRFLARLDWLRRQRPDLDLPEIGEEAIAAAVRDLCAGKRSLRELHGLPVLPLLESQMAPGLRRDLNRDAPDRVMLPSGRRAQVDYESGDEPCLAARLQEFFGLADTPRLAGGKVALVLQLLAPNHRPVQITRDLPSFWANVYPQVRNELRRKYPRHSWPDDPLTAKAESRPQRRRK